MALNVYLNADCTQLAGSAEQFAGPGSVFTVSAVPDQVYVYNPATGAATRLSLNTGYTLNGATLTLTTALLAGEILYCEPANRLEFNLSGSVGTSRSAIKNAWLKRAGAYVYSSILAYSQDTAVAHADLIVAGITFDAGVGSGFTGLVTNALVNDAVIVGGTVIGRVVSNTTTTITLDTQYTGFTDVRIVAIGDLLLSLDGLVYADLIAIADINTDAAVKLWVSNEGVIPATAVNYPNTSLVLDFSEFVE